MPKSREMGVSETGPGRTCWKSPHVAVGMTIADRPPHRSVLALRDPRADWRKQYGRSVECTRYASGSNRREQAAEGRVSGSASLILRRDQADEVGHFVQGDDAPRRVVHCQALGLVGVVHHQDGMHTDATGDLNALQGVREKHCLLPRKERAAEHVEEWRRLHAPCIVARAYSRQEITKRIPLDESRRRPARKRRRYKEPGAHGF